MSTDQSGAPPIAGQERIESWAMGEVQLTRILLPQPGMLTTLRTSADHVCMVLQECEVASLEHQGEKCCFDAGQWTYWCVDRAPAIRVHSHSVGAQLLMLEVPREKLAELFSAASREELQILRYEDHPLLRALRAFAVARARLDAVASARIGTMFIRMMECVIGEQQRVQCVSASANADRLNRIRQYILGRLSDSQLSFDDIAAFAGCSKRFVQMMFAECGETVRRFILRNRLELIHCLLLSSNLPITDIAVANGFNDHSHFGRVYRRRFGLTPSNARRLYRIVRAQHSR